MRFLKIGLQLLAAQIMAYAPAVQAAANTDQKKYINQYLQQSGLTSGKATWADVWSHGRRVVDAESQALMNGWLKNHGKEKVSPVQVQLYKEKNKDVMKVVMNNMGQTYVITHVEGEDQVTVDGKKFALSEISNIPSFAEKLSKNSLSLKDVKSSWEKNKKSVKISQKKSTRLTGKQIAALAPEKRVEYMMLWREVVEPASYVVNSVGRKNNRAENTEVDKFEVVWKSIVQDAFAAAYDEGNACLVAANISVYNNKGICLADPNEIAMAKFKLPNLKSYLDDQKRNNEYCRETNKSSNYAACNPISHGYAPSGDPFCVPMTQRNFTDKATYDCNKLSPLEQNKGAQRNADIRRILQSYYGKDRTDHCFVAENKVKKSCESMFESHLDMLNLQLINAEIVCDQKDLKADQMTACNEFKKRRIVIDYFSEDEMAAAACINAGGTYENGVCRKDDQTCERQEKEDGTITYDCTPTIVVTAAKDKCDASRPVTERLASWECSKGLYIFAGLAALLLLFKWDRNKKKKWSLPSEGGSGTGEVGSGGAGRPEPGASTGSGEGEGEGTEEGSGTPPPPMSEEVPVEGVR